jgi:hypothetical protein
MAGWLSCDLIRACARWRGLPVPPWFVLAVAHSISDADRAALHDCAPFRLVKTRCSKADNPISGNACRNREELGFSNAD